MSAPITGSMLYDLVACPHRVAMDLRGAAADRDPVSPFVQLLWEHGHAFERAVMQRLELPFTDLSALAGDEKQEATAAAMARGHDLIYSGRVRAGDLLGEPDLLRRAGAGYVAGDIKSGAGLAGDPDDRRPKLEYAVQLALYTDVLERLGAGGGRTPFIWDVHGDEVPYDLDLPRGKREPRSLWDAYREHLDTARAIAAGTATTPALAAVCKMCHWRSACTSRLIAADDLSLIPELGRAARDRLRPHVGSVRALAEADLAPLLAGGGRTIIPRLGAGTLRKYQRRARLLVDEAARPYLLRPLDLPAAPDELFFDIEVDPMRDLVYLHGFVHRRAGNGAAERFVPFLAEAPTPAEEERAFREAWAFVRASRPCVIYHYSPYERTWWRKLQERHPGVMTAEQVEEMFAPHESVDLYHRVVRSASEWPTRNYSIKTLATSLGFAWRDPDPSGAASIEWYHRWVQSGDDRLRRRILDYNEDDCRAMRVLLDEIRQLRVRR